MTSAGWATRGECSSANTNGVGCAAHDRGRLSDPQSDGVCDRGGPTFRQPGCGRRSRRALLGSSRQLSIGGIRHRLDDGGRARSTMARRGSSTHRSGGNHSDCWSALSAAARRFPRQPICSRCSSGYMAGIALVMISANSALSPAPPVEGNGILQRLLLFRDSVTQFTGRLCVSHVCP